MKITAAPITEINKNKLELKPEEIIKSKLQEIFYKKLKNISKDEADSIIDKLVEYYNKITDYLNEEKAVFQEFLNDKKTKFTLRNLEEDEKIKPKLYHTESGNEYARVLERGLSLLENLREEITKTKISTSFIYKTNDGKAYLLDKNELKQKNLVDIILSRRINSTGVNNFFNISYSVSYQKLKKEGMLDSKYQISDDKIYESIMKIKRLQVDDLDFISKYKNFKADSFDSKDAELYILLKKNPEVELNSNFYKKAYSQLGGGGGYATPITKGSDSADTSMKLVSVKNNSVVFARRSLILTNLQRFQKILSKDNNNVETIAKNLIDMFIESSKNVFSKDKFLIDFLEKGKDGVLEFFRLNESDLE